MQEYYCHVGCTHDHPTASAGLGIGNKAIKRIWKEIQDEKRTVHQELYNHTNDAIRKGIEKGFGKLKPTDELFPLKQQMLRNAARFSAYKSWWQTKELKLAEEGKAPEIDKLYNTNYLRTEQAHFTRSAREAKKWNSYWKDKDLYPFLEYMPSTAAEPDPVHMKLYGIIKAITDPFWNTWMPPSRYGCQCSVAQRRSDKGSTKVNLNEVELPPKALRNNPGKTGKAITDQHPMIAKVQDKSQQLANKLLEHEAAGYAQKLHKSLVKLHKGKKDGYVAEFSELTKESEYNSNLKIAKHLSAKGDAVELLETRRKASINISTADALVNGKLHEFKETASTSMNRLRLHLKDISNKKGRAHKQYITAVIRFRTEISIDLIKEAFKRSYNAGQIDWIDEAYFIMNNKLSKRYTIEELIR